MIYGMGQDRQTDRRADTFTIIDYIHTYIFIKLHYFFGRRRHHEIVII